MSDLSQTATEPLRLGWLLVGGLGRRGRGRRRWERGKREEGRGGVWGTQAYLAPALRRLVVQAQAGLQLVVVNCGSLKLDGLWDWEHTSPTMSASGQCSRLVRRPWLRLLVSLPPRTGRVSREHASLLVGHKDDLKNNWTDSGRGAAEQLQRDGSFICAFPCIDRKQRGGWSRSGPGPLLALLD